MTVLPMFPLGTVLFPYATLPLHVFEERYRVMTRRVMHGDREFGVVLIERGHEVGGGDARFNIGTIARIVHAQELPDGRWALATVGTRRIRVVRWLGDDPFPQAEVELLADDADDDDDDGAADARERVIGALKVVADLARRIDPSIAEPPALDPDVVRASYEASAMAPVGPLDAQRLLAANTASERLTMLATALDDHAMALRAHLGE